MSGLKLQRKRKLEIQEQTSSKCYIVSEKPVNDTKDITNNIVEEEQHAKSDVTKNHAAEQNAISADVKHVADTFFLDSKKFCQWQDITKENLCLQFTPFYSRDEASTLLSLCEQEFVYNVGDLATVKLFGKRISIPRKQVAHGDTGLTYTFSGNTVPARPWTPLLMKIRDQISHATGLKFNFVLINRYNDGHDYMGEHKDDERDLLPGHPIASLTLGQPRDFVFRHQDSRGKHAKRKIDPVSILLEHGMLLLMKHPTNSFWYHSLPRRTRALGVRVNMTFRNMQRSHCKPA